MLNPKPVILLFLTLIITTPAFAGDPKAVGDIVGRDLNDRWLRSFGHVGIWSGSRVLEVLDESRVIQMNSLSKFKQATSYWGAKYGIGSNHYKVIQAGWKQRYYNPEYARTPLWREGGYKRQCVRWYGGRCIRYEWKRVNAKFRCDTFVNYAYKKGIGKTLVYYYTPRHVYNSMPQTRY
ncbi:MAG: hypothetical protein ABFS56_27280 [Pseudomonadota bacterium]